MSYGLGCQHCNGQLGVVDDAIDVAKGAVSVIKSLFGGGGISKEERAVNFSNNLNDLYQMAAAGDARALATLKARAGTTGIPDQGGYPPYCKVCQPFTDVNSGDATALRNKAAAIVSALQSGTTPPGVPPSPYPVKPVASASSMLPLIAVAGIGALLLMRRR